MIKTVSDIADSYEKGRWHLQHFTKTWPSTYSNANAWFDSTMAGNFPRASYYPGDDLTFTTYPSGNHQSVYHGGDVAPAQKILRRIGIQGSAANLAPSRFILCDYLGFYTGISWETGGAQALDNTVTLPRYADGKGVQAFIVQLFGKNSTATYTINYTNTNDADIESPLQSANTYGTGVIQQGETATQHYPFVRLESGDFGIKKVNSVTVNSLGSGIAVLVLVKPLAEIIFRDSTLFAPVEKDFLTDIQSAPVVLDGAKLNFIFTSVGSPTGLINTGYCDFIWN